MKHALLITLLIFIPRHASADITWIGTSNGSWSEPTNWDLNRIPVESDTVIIGATDSLTIQVSEHPLFTVLSISEGIVTLDLADGIPLFSVGTCIDGEDVYKILNIADQDKSATLIFHGDNFIEFHNDCYGPLIDARIGFGDRSDGTLLFDEPEPAGIAPDSTFYVGYGTDSTGQIRFEADNALFLYSSIASMSTGSISISNAACVNAHTISGQTLITANESSKLDANERIQSTSIEVAQNATVRSDDIEASSILLESNAVLGYEWVYGATVEVAAAPVTINTTNWVDSMLRIELDNHTNPIIFGDKLYNSNIQAEVFATSNSTPSAPALITLMSAFGNADAGLTLTNAPDDGKTYSIVRDHGISTLRIAPPNWNPADLDFNGELDFFDISAFINYYQTGSPWANVDESSGINFFDVSMFLNHFNSP